MLLGSDRVHAAHSIFTLFSMCALLSICQVAASKAPLDRYNLPLYIVFENARIPLDIPVGPRHTFAYGYAED